MNSSSSTRNVVGPIGLFNSLTLESTKTVNIYVLLLNIVLVIVSGGIYLYSKKNKNFLNKGLAVLLLLFFILLFNLIWAIENSSLLYSYNNDYVMIYQAEQDPSSKNFCIANVVISWIIVLLCLLLIFMDN